MKKTLTLKETQVESPEPSRTNRSLRRPTIFIRGCGPMQPPAGRRAAACVPSRALVLAMLGLSCAVWAQVPPKPPTSATAALNASVYNQLEFSDQQDFEDANRGFIAGLEPPRIIPNELPQLNAMGYYAWNLEGYDNSRSNMVNQVVLTAPEVRNNTVVFSVVGVPGCEYVVSVSTNLIDWRPQATNTSPFTVTNYLTSGDGQQFYRASSFFPVSAPQIAPGTPLRLVAPGQVVTIGGSCFGNQKGEVSLTDTSGKTVPARVQDWSMNSITFEIPEGLSGTLILRVAHGGGFDTHRFWGTLTPLPPGGSASADYALADTYKNASGVFYNGNLWVFAPQYNAGTARYEIQCWWFQNGDFTHKGVPQPGGYTHAQVTPLVFDHELFLFHTGTDGNVYFQRFLTSSNKWESALTRVSTATVDPQKEVAPVYNSVAKRIELYIPWTNNTITWLYSDDKGASWHWGSPLPGVADVTTAPSAVFWQQTTNSGVAIVSFAIPYTHGLHDNSLELCYVENGVVVRSYSFGAFPLGRAQLADLGEDYFGMTWIEKVGDPPYMSKLSKQTGEWVSQSRPMSKGSHWPPNLVVNYELVPDSSSLGNRWDAILYMFWGYNWLFATTTKMSSIENLGYWQEVTGSPVTTDFGSSDTNFFETWPVIGVIDAPPFIQNGEEYVDDPPDMFKATRVQFTSESEKSAATEIGFQAGLFVETGEKSPLKLELSATAGNKWANEVSTKITMDTMLYRSKAGRVMVYYLAPEVEVHQVQWHNPYPTTNYMYPMRVTANTTGRVRIFDPTEFPVPGAVGMGATYFDLARFPVHQAESDRERLATYLAPVNEAWFAGVLDWNIGGEASLSWLTLTNNSSTFSTKTEIKIGYNKKDIVAFGIQGSFELQMQTSTTLSTVSQLWLINPWRGSGEEPPPLPDQINSFVVHARWLAPSESGFWVPLNRQGSGDKPWFITYGVSDVSP